ncbi:Hypothetical protein, putative [Bodo saltans]|uniref:Uncharacterized protein n=1 Tax=Bodo saltans TaxID=75058 RepID=A0A0S4IZI5_BODSA|nr:Hypothetical protein, putative [Bodo saltans]|eukprot:CUG05654.1 Hypothetical protein, putative [Bodo saltans]
MMTKASFMMNEHLKNRVPLVQLVHPTVLVGRGRILFPQGLHLIADIFKGKSPAEMYAHHYFIEKQTDPTQPSPQYHLTEEYQGMLKVMKGLRYMTDKTSKLDTTMIAIVDEESNDVYLYNPVELDEQALPQFIGELATWGVPEAKAEVEKLGEVRRVTPIQRAAPAGVQNTGGSLNISAESAIEPTSHGVPSAYSRYRDARSGTDKRGGTNTATRRVAGIILPTRQSMWEPLTYWTQLFPDATILSSLPNAPPREHLTKQGISEEMEANIVKRMQPISTVDVKDANLSNNVTRLPTSSTNCIELVRVVGDPSTDEYVLYHKESASLSCTDLFHGGYSDFDPVNSWMCRVFFKFMKDGNYKRADLPPRYKQDAIKKNGDMSAFVACVEQLCSDRFDWNTLLFAHGTPPLVADPKESLKLQWALRQATAEDKLAVEREIKIGGEELYGNVPEQKLEDDFLLRRRRF